MNKLTILWNEKWNIQYFNGLVSEPIKIKEELKGKSVISIRILPIGRIKIIPTKFVDMNMYYVNLIDTSHYFSNETDYGKEF